MGGSVLSFLKAEWKVSDTGSAHWASSLKYTLPVWNLTKIFSSTVNISFAKVVIATEFLLATSEI